MRALKASEDAPDALDSRVLWLFYGLALLLALVPIFVTTLPPLVDLPNHLARIYILNHLDTDPALQKYYGVHWHLLGFQSLDILLPPLARWFGLFAAARIYIAISLILVLGGSMALHRALFGRIGLFPLASTLFLYNLLLAWGFVSYLFSVGVALLMLAGWFGSEGRSRLLRVSVFSVATLLLLVCHFFTFAAYAVLIGTYELSRIWHDPRRDLRRGLAQLVEGGLPFVLPCILVVAAYVPQTVSFTKYGSFPDVARAVVSPTVMYMTWPDLVVTYAVVFGLWFCWRRRLLRLSKRMRWPLLAMAVTGAFMPIWLFSVWGASYRIPSLIAFLAVSTIDLQFKNRRQIALFVSIVLGLLLLRVTTTIQVWHDYQANFLEFLAATAKIDAGSRVLALPVPDNDGTWPAPQIYPYSQLATLAVVERDVLSPTLFKFATPLAIPQLKRGLVDNLRDAKHPLDWRPTDPRFAAATPATIREVETVGESSLLRGSYFSPVDWSRWPEDYDYLIVFAFSRKENPVPALLTPVAEGSFFTIYRIHPPETGKSEIQ